MTEREACGQIWQRYSKWYWDLVYFEHSDWLRQQIVDAGQDIEGIFKRT